MEQRKINLNAINGMDVRDFNLDQQTVPEIINLKKDKNGWQIRDSKHEVLSGLDINASINSFIIKDSTKIVLHIDKAILIYYIDNDELGNLIDRFDFDYDFKLYKTNYPDVFFQIDITNHKSYILEFTDRVMTLINDAGNVDLSTELLLNEFDSASGDFTWGGMCRHAELTTTINNISRTYTTGIDKYCVNYDTYNATTANEWSSIALLQQINNFNNQSRYLLVSGQNSDTYVYVFGWDDKTPYKWERKLKLAGTNVFKTANTNGNSLSKNMDVVNKLSGFTESYSWNTFAKDDVLNSKSVDVIFNTDAKYVLINAVSYGLCIKKYTDTTFSLVSTNAWRDFDKRSNLFCGSNQDGSVKKIGYYKNFPVINDADYIDIYGDFATILGSINESSVYPQYIRSDSNGNIYCLSNWTSPRYLMKYIGSGKWERLEECPGTAYSMEYLGGNYDYIIVGTSVGAYKIVNDAFVAAGTLNGNIGKNLKSIQLINNDIYACGYGLLLPDGGVVKLTNGTGTWEVVGTGIIKPITYLEYSEKRNSLYVSVNFTAAKNIYVLNGLDGAWAEYGEIIPSVNTLVSTIRYDLYSNLLFAGVNSAVGIFSDNYNSYYANTFFNIYIPNSDKISALYTIDGTTLTYNNTYISSNVTTAKAVKTMQEYFTPCQYVNYLACVCNNNVKIFVETIQGTKEEAAKINTFSLGTSVNYNSVSFLTVSHNKAYDENFGMNVNYKVQSILVGYNDVDRTRVDNWFLKVGNVTASIERQSISGAISNTSPYFLANNFYSSTIASSTNIQENGKTNYIYVCVDKKIYKFPMTGLQVTDSDIDAIEEMYNSEISRYADVDGQVLSAVISDTQGYVRTEINKSKPLPLRPYFTADATGTDNTNTFTRNVITVQGDTNNLITSANVFITFTPNAVVNVITDNGRLYWNVVTCTVSNLRTVTVYNTYARTCIVMQGSRVIANGTTAVVNLCAFNQTYTVNAQTNVTITIPAANVTDVNSNSQMITLLTNDTPEYFNMYEMVVVDGRNFRTPVEVGQGTQQLINSDDYSIYHKYWIFYLLWSGLYDDTVPYINIAKGTKNPLNLTYDFKFWKQDPEFINDVYNNYVGTENLPARFSNIEANFQDSSTTTAQTYVINDKIFQKWGDTYRDKFSSVAFWQQNKAVLFEIQDMTFSASELAMVLDYSTKSAYWSTGFKFINLLNRANLLSKPVAIQELNQNTGIIACENDLYYISGSDESNIILTYIGANIGLEKDNYKSLVTNGAQGFFYNRKGLWMIEKGNVIAIHPPIEEYLYRQSSGNTLGVDNINNLLYIPLDITRWKDIDNVQTHLQTVLQSGDYGVSVDTTTAFDVVYGVFDYKDLNYRIYAYELPAGELATSNNFIGNFKDHVIIRAGNKIIIPEYREAQGTENPLCRIKLKKMAFGSAFNLKKLDTLLAQFYNNQNSDLDRYGVDYLKLYIILDGEVIWEKKYGDFRATDLSSYTDTTADSAVPSDTDVGFKNIKLPLGLDFHDIQIMFEFGRLNSIGVSVASINEINLNVINKGSERNGMF